MASEPAIVLSDDSDKEVEEIGPSSRQRVLTRQHTSGRSAGTLHGRQRQSRKPPAVTPAPLQVQGTRRRRTTQDSIVDLTLTPDEEITLLGSSGPVRPSAKRKASPCKLLLPESPVARPSAKCGICFQNMDEKMCCGPCGHVFCEVCLRQAVKTQKKCPTCRRNLQPKQIHRIFLNT